MEKHKNISRLWLLIGVAALAIAGLYSLTLVAGRAPVFSNNQDIQRIFKDALVVHVDLSVLIWFLSIACLFWSSMTKNHKPFLPYLEEAGLICLVLAIIAMMVSPFMPNATAMMSNYIPMINTPMFMISLALVLCSIGFMLLKLFLTPLDIGSNPLRFGMVSAGWITVIAIGCFIWSYHLMPSVIEGEQYFDMLFWGGGHVLQFTHTQVVMVVWWMLVGILLPHKPISEKLLYLLFALGVFAALLSPVAYFLYDVASSEFRQFFTHKMIALNGIAPSIVALIIVCWMLQARDLRKGEKRALWSCSLISAVLFIYGGVLGLLITGQNVVIPAHYHGSIVGITLAFMGYAYAMLPQFGYRDPNGTKLAYWQPIIYGIGQVMHVSGLAYSGGYGVLRKTAGGVDKLPVDVQAALGIMGMGGLFAIAGGLMFVVVVYKSIKN